MYGPASSTSTSRPDSARIAADDGPSGARADDDDVAVLTAPGRLQVTQPLRGVGQRRHPTVHLASHLVSDGGAHPSVVAVSEPGEHLQEEEKVRGERQPRALELGQELLPGVEAGAAEAPRERQHLEPPERHLHLADGPVGQAAEIGVDGRDGVDGADVLWVAGARRPRGRR